MINRKVVVLVASSSIVAGADAQWVQWSGNGHWYQAVSTSQAVSWAEAEADAESQGGTLATITSGEENLFVFDLINAPQYWHFNHDQFMGPWLGAQAPLSRSNAASDWTWVTGETWSYSAWNPGEPNNLLVLEDSLQFVTFPCTDFNSILPVWNDLSGDPAVSKSEFGPETYVNGYVVERNTAVPEPSAALILLAGGFVVKNRWLCRGHVSN